MRHTHQPRILFPAMYFYDMETHSCPNRQRDGTDGHRISDIFKGLNRLHRQQTVYILIADIFLIGFFQFLADSSKILSRLDTFIGLDRFLIYRNRIFR